MFKPLDFISYHWLRFQALRQEEKRMTCEHTDYDDYFEKCNDCNMSVEEIHETGCKFDPAGFITDDDGRCTLCGMQLEEAA